MKKAILIQIREDKKIANQEYNCFLKISQKARVILDKLNVCYDNLDVKKTINKYDYILIGGSPFSVEDDFSQKKKIKDLILSSVGAKKPFLGVCFGFQMLVWSLGGKIILDKKNKEFATKKVSLAKEGRKEKIFSNLPNNFYVQEAHEWRVSKIPKETKIIAIGQRVKIQGIKIAAAPVYGVQFHPELKKSDMKFRMKYYNANKNSVYNFNRKDFDGIEQSLDSEKIVFNFLKYH